MMGPNDLDAMAAYFAADGVVLITDSMDTVTISRADYETLLELARLCLNMSEFELFFQHYDHDRALALQARCQELLDRS
jgi:hypothetical protein